MQHEAVDTLDRLMLAHRNAAIRKINRGRRWASALRAEGGEFAQLAEIVEAETAALSRGWGSLERRNS